MLLIKWSHNHNITNKDTRQTFSFCLSGKKLIKSSGGLISDPTVCLAAEHQNRRTRFRDNTGSNTSY